MSMTAPGSPSNFIPFTNDNNVSYFVGVDANETNAHMVLSGDRNLAVAGKPVRHGLLNVTPKSVVTWTKNMHKNAGNIAWADGSVQRISSAMAGKVFTSVTGTNRFAMP